MKCHENQKNADWSPCSSLNKWFESPCWEESLKPKFNQASDYVDAGHDKAPLGLYARPVAETTDNPDSAIERFYELIGKSRINDARALIEKLKAEWPNSERVKHLARVYAPPVVRSVEKKLLRPMKEERAWIRENAHLYPGEWLSVRGNMLIHHHPNLQEVIVHTKNAIGEDKALLHYQPED